MRLSLAFDSISKSFKKSIVEEEDSKYRLKTTNGTEPESVLSNMENNCRKEEINVEGSEGHGLQYER